MSTQVLCVMENHSPSSPYYPLESTVFSSGSVIENDKECESSESTFDTSLNGNVEEEEKQHLEKQDRCEEHVVVKKIPLSVGDGERNEIQPTCCSRRHPTRCFLMGTFRTLRYVVVGILSCAAQTSIGLLDFIISLCMNEGVHNVIMVTLTVAVEVFVIMVFAVATILATIIINVDDAYRNRREKTYDKESAKVEHAQGAVYPVRVKISKTRSARREKSARRASKPSKLNIHMLQCGENETEDSLCEMCNNCPVNKNLPPSEGFDNDAVIRNYETDTNDSLQLEDSIIQEEINEGEKCGSETPICGDTETVKSEANESLPLLDSGNNVNNKQSTIYRFKILTIQDNDTLLKKQNHHRAPKSTGRDFDDVNKEQTKDKNDSFPNETSVNDGESKDRADKTNSAVLTSSPSGSTYNLEIDSVSTSQLSMSDCSECRSEIENSNGDTPMSFVSTKKIFESNNKN